MPPGFGYVGGNSSDFQGKGTVTELSIIWLITVSKFRFAGTENHLRRVLKRPPKESP